MMYRIKLNRNRIIKQPSNIGVGTDTGKTSTLSNTLSEINEGSNGGTSNLTNLGNALRSNSLGAYNEDILNESNIISNFIIHPYKISKKDFSSKPWVYNSICLLNSIMPLIIVWFIPRMDYLIAIRGAIISTSII